MKRGIFCALLMGSVALAQNDYPELAIDYCWTDAPTTPLPHGAPWGRKTANGTNPYPPNTGVIRTYNWTVSRGVKASDGYEKEGIFINDQFPGPLIEANWGDTVQVTLYNNITGPEDGTALHWHGLTLKDYQWMDGVPGVQQCPIPYGKSFTYSFIADLYGTGWYHSHYAAQYADGYFGPMVFHGPKTVEYDIDKGPIMLHDYFHTDSVTLEELSVGTDESKVVPYSNNNLINGRNFDCSGKEGNDTTPCDTNTGVSKFKFTAGKKHRLRLINAGGDGQQKFSIDGHKMTIIAQDFVPIKPYYSEVVTVGIGQRTDVIVEGLGNCTGAYTMRSVLVSCSDDYQPLATALVYYSDEALQQGSTSTPWPALNSSLTDCGNDDIALAVPWYAITPTEPTVTQEMEIDVRQNASGNWEWTVNNSSFRANYNEPVLLLSYEGNNTYPDDPEWNVYNFGTNTSIRILLRNPGFAVHPMHLHGHNFYILAAGPGEWDGTTIINPDNPQRRDTLLIPTKSYVVIQFEADNPGAWPFHCHIAAHVSGGLYVTILERPDEIANLRIPDIMAQTCEDYVEWEQRVTVNQIDSGV